MSTLKSKVDAVIAQYDGHYESDEETTAKLVAALCEVAGITRRDQSVVLESSGGIYWAVRLGDVQRCATISEATNWLIKWAKEGT